MEMREFRGKAREREGVSHEGGNCERREQEED